MRICRRCSEEKPDEAFVVRKKIVGSKTYADRICRKCNAEQASRWRTEYPDRHRAGYQRYNSDPKNKQRIREYRIYRNYGLTLLGYESLFRAQGGKCQICNRVLVLFKSARDGNDAAQLDHCHESGKIRGFLCAKCNRAIGLIGDSVERLNRAVEHVRRGE